MPHDQSPQHSHEDGGDGLSAYDVVQQQNQFYQAALEAHRAYVLSQIDTLRLLIAQGVSKDELKERIEILRKNFETDIERVQTSVSSVGEHLNRVEENIVRQIDTMANKQATLSIAFEGRQKESLKRIVAIQTTILLFIVTTLIGVAINFIFHH